MLSNRSRAKQKLLGVLLLTAMMRTSLTSISEISHVTTKRSALELICLKGQVCLMQGQVVWEGATADFDNSEEAIVRQFSRGSLEGPIKYL